jgi:6-pyruvoyltetrahydropterin/6-carboxytetrahydropterin synthase
VIDAFDHAICFWDRDEADYIAWAKHYSARWISMPVSPSAEQFSRLFFALIDAILNNTTMANGEGDVVLHSVIAHETETGYAQCFRQDAYNPRMGNIALSDIVFSDQCKAEWRDPAMLEKLMRGEHFTNPTIPLQVLP